MVWVTAAHRQEAQRIARALVDERRAACVSWIPGVRSVYRWKGKVEDGREVLLMIKTTAARWPALEKRIRQLHSYSVPEILALPVRSGSRAYLDWIRRETAPRRVK